MAGLFDTFTVAKRGLNVQQGAINTTSHNIANANTVGFSRQRAVATTTRPFGGMSKFDTCSVGQVGTGAEISSIERIRDSFMDYQVREQNGKLGISQVKDKSLNEVQGIFGEPSDSGIQQILGEFYDSFQELEKTPEKSAARTVALQKASTLADGLNNIYTQLENSISNDQQLLQINIKDVNSYLNQINELNKQISSVCAVGQKPNDLMDSRDNLLDQLSSKFGITIDRKDREAIDLKADGFQNSKNPINNLVNSSPTDDKYTRFSYVKSADVTKDKDGNPTGEVILKYYPLGNLQVEPKTITITGDPKKAQETADNLIQNRILIANKNGIVSDKDENEITSMTSFDDINKKVFQTYKCDPATNSVSIDANQIKGEIAGNQGVQNNVKDYMKKLDQIAAALAYSVNAIQTGSSDGTKQITDILVFTNGTDENGISAKNITLNKALLEDVSKLNCGATSEKGERAGERALAIAKLRDLKINMASIKDIDNREKFFKSDCSGISFSSAENISLQASKEGTTIDAYFRDITNTLGVNAEAAIRDVDTVGKQLQDLQMQRLSTSGVSLDEETTNLIQFQHAYQANAKVISTVDELLDVVINGLKK
ncbi:flagellar hook-associated protein FlgK [Clostridium uliginosum]|uniref:Flagellar hook-associated protein 1 n=1 Tax=Clostridium uliginosum TaxID=119641 RepID=A0A1I1KP69_9CLOT|nr:flagellar hook-associated protein FlgK [Clostridium uliginosum]SFC60478.1 flagellar hook-associated protein 1 FlgK [Clostridium uliginosum]